MATVGLKGIWGLEQLDRTGVATWKLGAWLMGGSGLAGLAIFLFLDHLDLGGSDFMRKNIVGPFVFFASLFLLFLTLVLSRATESDLRQLALIDSSAEDGIRLLRPSKYIMLPSIVFGITIFFIVVLAAKLPFLGRTVIESFSALNSGGMNWIVIQYVFVPLLGVAGGTTLATHLSQSQSLVHTAHHLNIDLLQLSQYTNIANPLVRFVVAILLVLTLCPFFVVFDPALGNAVQLVMLALVIVSTPILLLYAYPILVLRNRIKEEKVRELSIVFQALEGDDEAITAARIRRPGLPLSIGDLLIHQMFVESRWEWPIASHLQKLILFGLLPPLTWVLAATIENVIY